MLPRTNPDPRQIITAQATPEMQPKPSPEHGQGTPGMSTPQASVVIPVYNLAWSIDDTIKSVRAQTMGDFELIVVDDGSTDNLLDVIGRHAQADARIRVVRQGNRGLAAARNRGLAEASSDQVAFIDADDIWHPRFLEDMTSTLSRNRDVPFAYALSFRIDGRNRLIPALRWTRAPRHDFVGLLTLNSVGNGSAALYRCAAVQAAGGFDESLRARGAPGAEDWKLCLQLAASRPPALVPLYRVAYRLVETSMSQANPACQLRSIRTVMADIRAQFPDVPVQHFADARTMMNGWLLPAFLRQRRYGMAARLVLEAYLLNPRWFRSRDLCTIHLQKAAELAMSLYALMSPSMHARPALADLVEDDTRPFSFLAE